jgi:hypothetical protein
MGPRLVANMWPATFRLKAANITNHLNNNYNILQHYKVQLLLTLIFTALTLILTASFTPYL